MEPEWIDAPDEPVVTLTFRELEDEDPEDAEDIRLLAWAAEYGEDVEPLLPPASPLALDVVAADVADELTVGRRDQYTGHAPLVQPCGDLLDWARPSHGSWAVHHDLLRDRFGTSIKVTRPEPSKDDPVLVQHYGERPLPSTHLVADRPNRIPEAADGDVSARYVYGTPNTRVPAFDRQPRDQPVIFAWPVPVNLVEAESFEPRRGSRA